MKLVETPKSLKIYFRHITKPRATFFDLLVSTAIYELFCNKNALEIGCFTGANTLHLANIAKAKNTTIIAFDFKWARQRPKGIEMELHSYDQWLIKINERLPTTLRDLI